MKLIKMLRLWLAVREIKRNNGVLYTPITVLKDGRVVDGEIRLEAARYLKIQNVPTIMPEDIKFQSTNIVHLRNNVSINKGA